LRGRLWNDVTYTILTQYYKVIISSLKILF
jgi:hypothetical protein